MEVTGPIREINVSAADWENLRDLPWGVPLDDWATASPPVEIIDQRRGMSRHPVIFVQAGNRKYAIKETSPETAKAEIENYIEISRRGCPSLVPVGSVVIVGELIPAGEIGGISQFTSGDMGYCITQLATRVLPQSLLYQYPFTQANKKMLLVAIAQLLATLHEAGVYWGDPSLANALIDLSRRRLLAVLADAETVQLYPSSLNAALRQADVDFFVESMRWQSEDIRIARDLPEDETVLDESDADFFIESYASFRESRNRRVLNFEVDTALARLGGGFIGLGAWAWRAGISGVENTLRPAWYRERLRDLIGIWVPRTHARRIYDLLLGHKWLMSEEAGHDVGLAEAAQDWRERYHDPLIQILQAYAPGQTIDYDRYLAIMHHLWQLSQDEGRPVPIEEGAIDYLLPRAG